MMDAFIMYCKQILIKMLSLKKRLPPKVFNTASVNGMNDMVNMLTQTGVL